MAEPQEEQIWSSPDLYSGWAQPPQTFCHILCHNTNMGNPGGTITAWSITKDDNRDI